MKLSPRQEKGALTLFIQSCNPALICAVRDSETRKQSLGELC